MASRSGIARRELLLGLGAPLVAQPPAEPEIWFSCPMDPEIRSRGPARCSKCGMALAPAVARPEAYRLELDVKPRSVPAGRPLRLTFRVRHPKTGELVRRFEQVHERLFHLFVVNHTLAFFAHEHPEIQRGGSFVLPLVLPEPGIYRLVSDFYPVGGTPQFLVKTLATRGYAVPFRPAVLAPDLEEKAGGNVRIGLRVEPAMPFAGKQTRLRFRVHPADRLELFLGAWAHLMAVSDDGIDAVHAHPALAEGREDMQFNLIFPRARRYRVWIQVQRAGVVNTVAFTVPVARL